MDLYQLKTFHFLAQNRSFKESAKKLFVTTSAVSHSLKKLEENLQTTLVNRAKNRPFLTVEGKILFEGTKKIFNEIDLIKESIELKRDGHLGLINLGATVEFGSNVLIHQIDKFLHSQKGVHVDFHFHHDLLTPLLHDEVDLIIDCKDHQIPTLKKIPLFEEEYIVIVSKSYKKKKNIGKVMDLERCNVLSIDKSASWWNNFITSLDVCQRPHFSKITRINHIRGIINATLASLGVGFVPKYSVTEELKSGELINPFKKLKLTADSFSIYIKKEKERLVKTKLLIEFLKKHVSLLS